MDKETRNRIQRATQDARALLEREFAEQLEGVFDIHLNGTIANEPGSHLDAEQRVLRTKLVAAVEHLQRAEGSKQRAEGSKQKAEAVGAYLREAAFTALNRFVALKMLEARGLVQECISRGEQSSGFKEFAGLAPGLVQLPDRGYRLYIESIFDEIGREVRVLFDRRDPASLLWPRRQALLDLLAILNASELAEVWKEDETIGWVYQYFNSDADREKARYDEKGKPKAPQNSYELAVRNQFFTPRYVVEFLTDNTLGRIWYEMRQGKTRLVDECDYLVQRPSEVFLAEDEQPPEEDVSADENLGQEELLKKTVYIPFRPKKDPRDLKILDPACGSGHFLLYAFDLLLTIYEEAWEDETSPRSQVTGCKLRDDYPDLGGLRCALPGLALRHNLHGIDIDPRAAQIAALALWMRAQRTYNDFNVSRGERPPIAKTNIVVAEPMPGEKELRQEFITSLDRKLGQLVERVFEKMGLAGEAGSLLKIEDEIQTAIQEIYGESGELFRKGDEERWQYAEEKLLSTLAIYAKSAHEGQVYQRRLFAEDTARGFAFIDLSRERYDVVLMNPPFGDASLVARPYIESRYPRSWKDMFCAFIERSTQLAANGRLGSVGPRTSLFLPLGKNWRRDFLLGEWHIAGLADLGIGVLDNAKIEVAAYVLSTDASAGIFLRAIKTFEKEISLRTLTRLQIDDINRRLLFVRELHGFLSLPAFALAYWVSPRILRLFTSHPRTEGTLGVARVGLQTSDDFTFIRLMWEVSAASVSTWAPLAKGGGYSPFFGDIHLVTKWSRDGIEICAFNEDRYGSASRNVRSKERYFQAGVTWSPRTTTEFAPRVLPVGCIFGQKGPSLLIESLDAGAWALAVLNSRVYQYLLTIGAGAADIDPGSISKSYGAGLVQATPVPCKSSVEAASLAVECWRIRRTLAEQVDITSAYFRGLPKPERALDMVSWLQSIARRIIDTELNVVNRWERLNTFVLNAYGLTEYEATEIIDEVGTVMRRSVFEEEAFGDSDDDDSENTSVDKLTPRSWGVLRKLAREQGISTEQAYAILTARLKSEVILLRPVASEVLDYYFGTAIGVWQLERVLSVADEEPFHEIPLRRPTAIMNAAGILVDDPGHSKDLNERLREVAKGHWGEMGENAILSLFSVLGEKEPRSFLQRTFFDHHLTRYSRSRRKAPIYWQLAVPSASYSVWLYYHRFTKDTFYTVLNDYVTPKLQHEERKLTALVQNSGGTPAAGQRKEIAEQEAFVEELRTFREEVARIASLWNPDLNDGVIVNFAPLWRLVPQHRAWQKECKDCWDKLVAGDYDWAHLAMHLWPERVVPKCAKDRSLAIAHGLEEEFWIEDANGKWQPRKVDQTTVNTLIKERTSAAVKDALKSLLEAPSASVARRSQGKRSTTRGAGQRRQQSALAYGSEGYRNPK
ncbi:MAG: BREX-1 system adenine-specific DNA-methyltransferase PglX [Candidatus Binatia bacterium]